jgi:hypothetical protein
MSKDFSNNIVFLIRGVVGNLHVVHIIAAGRASIVCALGGSGHSTHRLPTEVTRASGPPGMA